jgi:phytoene dehydrogenase-like protein
MYDTIIIGAGMSGMAAGIRLAHFDQRVCILERHYTIGGLNSFYRLRGRDYDVGLHAVTNYASRDAARQTPLGRILRQLRFRWEDFALAPQIGSKIVFPGVELNFGNGVELMEAEIASKFPSERAGFRQLLERLQAYDDLDATEFFQSARLVVSQLIRDPLLVEMLLCAPMWYGNAREHDMDFGNFSRLFRAMFLEGLARPFKGVRVLIKNLIRRFRQLGGELRLRSGVARIRVEDGRAVGVELDNGQQLSAHRVLSSAGRWETLRLCDDLRHEVPETRTGQISCAETVSVLDCQPQAIGHDATMTFFNDSPTFRWHKPAELCDLRSGVICSPNNFLYDSGQQLADGMLRVSTLANYDRWHALSDEEYRLEKLRWYDRIADVTARYMPEFRHHVIDTDMFTPRTIKRFTWHDNGAIYGAPDKQLDGRTHLNNLFLCGTDQGFVGVIGAIISGIAMANRHCLLPQSDGSGS